jgi:hypothetical protein
MLSEIPHRREEQGRVTEPEHHAGQIALTRGYAWLAGQILFPGSSPLKAECADVPGSISPSLARALITILAGYRPRTRTLLPARPGPGR